MASVVATPVNEVGAVQAAPPEFIQAINDDHQAQVAHTFVLYGNIYDLVDNSAADKSIKKVLATYYDDNTQSALGGSKVKQKDAGLQDNCKASPRTRIVAFYNTSTGLEFPNVQSLKMFIEAHEKVFGKEEMEDWGKTWFAPKSPEQAMAVINRWFYVNKQLLMRNNANKLSGEPLSMELTLTLIFTDADTLFPAGDIASLSMDRQAIVYIRNWAQDEFVGARNRIILLTRHLTDIHESIRGELAVSHNVRKPNLQDRLEWLKNYDAQIKMRMAVNGGKPLTIGKNTDVTGLEFAEDFDINEFAVQSAGMNRRQMKDVLLASFRNQAPIDFSLVQERKKRALEDEYGGMIDIKEPKFGFDQIGGHDSFKEYCRWNVIKPLRESNKRMCSRGALLTGPPGTGKSMVAWALAKEAGLNFIQVDLGKVFGGHVGDTERNTRKLLEAVESAAPCIVFIDEIDSVLSSGRSSAGDSGTSARVFNNIMTWLSDPGRQGKVVVIAATNRPDLLDSALIRQGRMDAILPMLAPAKGDVMGRWNILRALTIKHKVVVHPALQETRATEGNGLGKLLHDKERIWTGAEMEAVLQASLHKAYRASRQWTVEAIAEEKMANPKRKVFPQAGDTDLRIQTDDFNGAMDAIIPRTAEVELQTDLALFYANNLDYCPEDWRESARDKEALKEALKSRGIEPTRLAT